LLLTSAVLEAFSANSSTEMFQSITWIALPCVLRHTCSGTAIQKDISLPALQRLPGHDRLTTTEIYLTISDARCVTVAGGALHF
jgi:site-specific recombinase XerD